MDIRKKHGLSQGALRRLEANYKKMRHNAAKRDVPFELSLYEYIKLTELAQSGTTKCFYTGTTLSTKINSPLCYSIERLSDRHPYRIDNLVLVTRESNLIKDAVFDKRYTSSEKITARMWDVAKKIEKSFNNVERREKQRDYIINYCSEGDYRPPKFSINHTLSADHNVSRGIVADDFPPSVSDDVAIAQQYLAFYEEHRHNNFDLSFKEFSSLVTNASCQLRGYSLSPGDALVLVKNGEDPITISNCTVISRKSKEEFFNMAISAGLNNAFATLQKQVMDKGRVDSFISAPQKRSAPSAAPVTAQVATPFTAPAPATTTKQIVTTGTDQQASHTEAAPHQDKPQSATPTLQPPSPERDSIETHLAREKAKGLRIFDHNDRFIVRKKNCNLTNQACIFKHYFVNKNNILMMSICLVADQDKRLTLPYSFAFTLKDYMCEASDKHKKRKVVEHHRKDDLHLIEKSGLHTGQLTAIASRMQG
ncbi:TPA: hypothetical protein ACSCYS_003429 [Aeromonas veronii]